MCSMTQNYKEELLTCIRLALAPKVGVAEEDEGEGEDMRRGARRGP